jgi:RHS repeat-associated protein
MDPQFMRTGTGFYFYHNDELGTPQQLSDPIGNRAWGATSEAFGRTHVDGTSTVDNPLPFPGQYFDAETDMAYNYFRNYDPTSGRYVQADLIGLQAWILDSDQLPNPCGYVEDDQ